LAGIAFCVSIQFAVLEHMKRVFRDANNGGKLTPVQFYVAGGIAGVANSVISGPVEHIRCERARII
jgi:solute carrier family 25 carnitine/acylcarnitine transporter 20/29